MNMSPRIWISLAFVVVFTAAPLEEAAAQYECCPTNSVVAYQPVVTPVDPGLINGWYPGKLLDRWAASRAAYRATASATTAAYRPLSTTVPMTSYRPATSLFSRSYMPVSVYRPVVTQPVVATTAYSPITATTAYSPIVTSSAACCDPCSTGTAVSYPSTTSACCGVTAPATSYGGGATPVPTLRADEPAPDYSYQQQSQRPTTNANGPNPSGQEESALTNESEDADGADSGASPTNANPTGFEPPALHDPRMPAETPPPDDRTAIVDRTRVIPTVYREPVRTRVASEGQNSSPAPSQLPSRAERDAGWTAVSD